MKKLLLLLVIAVLAGGQILLAQTRVITGTVSSSTQGEGPIPGAAVRVKDSSIGVLTDVNGRYSINVPQGSNVLQISFIGMKPQEVEISGRTNIDVVLETEMTGLQEVVVTALGVSREKKSLGYATQQVTGESVSTVKTDNFINSLSGKVAGVDIKANGNLGGSTNIVIRGAKSLTGSNQALFVIDGVPIDNSNINNSGQIEGRSGYDYGNAASDINPNDIESIDVLKGAAASALYGSRAANGVIMITTKKGSYSNGKVVGVTLNTGVTFGMFDKNTFPKYQKSYGAGYGPFYSNTVHPGLDYVDVNGDGVPEYVTPMYEDASFGEAFDPSLMVYHYSAFVPESPNFGQATPWVVAANLPDKFFQTAVTTNNSLDITGGTENSAFRLGYTNLYQTGIMPNSLLNRNSFTFNGSHNVLDNLKVSVSANYTNTRGKGRNSTGYSDNIMTSFRQWYEVNTDIKEQEDLFNATGLNTTWNRKSFDNPQPNYWDNPYWVRFKNYETDERNRLIGYTQVDWKIADWVSIMGRLSVDTYSELQEERKAVGSVSGEFGVGRPTVTSGYSRLSRNFFETNGDLMATFKKDITSSINFTGLIGTNIRRQKIDQVFESTNNGISVSDVYALSNSVDPMVPPEELLSKIGVNGYFASVSLGFNNMFYLDGTYRIDQSSTLPKDSWTYSYPSISGSWLFSEVIKRDWLSLGKLRLNYAEVGHDAPFASVKDTYVPVAPFSGNPLVSVNDIKNNANLKPERTRSIEGGLEMNFYKNRVGFDLALYKSNTIDQILPVSVSYATGYASKFVNAGELQNKGVELKITAAPVRSNDFSWDITVNYTRNRNEVVSLESGIENLQLASLQGGVTINARVGEPYGTIQGTDYVYTTDGQRKIDPQGYYEITQTSDNIIGNINPDFLAGIQNVFSYKNISLSFLIDMQQGGSIFSLDQSYGQATGIYPETVFTNDLGNPVRNPVIGDLETGYDPSSGGVILSGVHDDGTVNQTRVPANDYTLFGYVSNPNKAFVYDASYVKLREVVLTYNFPKKMFSKASIAGASLSFVGSNLWIIHKDLPYADPESSQSSGNVQGWQSGVLPAVRNYGFNLKLQF